MRAPGGVWEEKGDLRMEEPLQFDYYYGSEAEQFRFFRIPKILFEQPYFKPLSCESKLLYGLMLDKMTLSQRNGWMDEESRTYIIFTVESVTEDIGCSRDKARKLVSELEAVGLIEKKRRGLGKPDIIYVKNFVKLMTGVPPSRDGEGNSPQGRNRCSRHGTKDTGNCSEAGGDHFDPETQEKTLSGENETMGGVFSEDEESAFKKAEKPFSRSRKNRLLEGDFSAPNDTNINDTDSSDTNPIQSIYPEEARNATPEDQADGIDMMDGSRGIPQHGIDAYSQHTGNGHQPQKGYGGSPGVPAHGSVRAGESRCMVQYAEKNEGGENPAKGEGINPLAAAGLEEDNPVIRLIRRNIDYEQHMESVSYGDREMYDGLYHTICDVVLGKADAYTIGGVEYPAGLVRGRFLKLETQHLYYAIERISSQKGEIRNMRKYMIATLFNATATIDAYYTQLAKHDMEGGGWVEKGIIGQNPRAEPA